MSEQWERIDEKGFPTGDIINSNDKRAFEDGIFHLGADVWIINKNNKILIQKRSDKKRVYPNVWAMTGGSVILGEKPVKTIVREAKEELDIDIDPSELRFMTKFRTENVWIETYSLRHDYDISKMKLQENEVSDVKWATWEEINTLVENGKFIGHRWEFVNKLLKDEIEAEIRE